MSSVPPSATVLLVEDDQNDVLLLQRAWRKANLPYSLQVVGNGEDAIDYLAGRRAYANRSQYPFPALLLLDLKLPRTSGAEVLEWLRQQAALRRLPVVVLTSSREPAEVHQIYDLHANSYLVKPPTAAALQDLVTLLSRYWLTINEPPL